MNDVFISILNNAWNTLLLIAAVIVLRPVLKKAPKYINCVLWGIVGIKLMIPLDITSKFSLLPEGRPVETLPDEVTPIYVKTGITPIDSGVNEYVKTYTNSQPAADNTVIHWMDVAGIIWIIGIALMIIYLIASYIMMKRKVAGSVAIEKGVSICDEIDSPFLFGIIKPHIYLPSGMSDSNREYVLAHERMHLKRRDYLWKLVAFIELSIYWFNPVLWLAYILMCRDIELACDEMVIKKMDAGWRADYCQALLACSIGKRKMIVMPVAFGEVGVKERIKRVCSYKKMTLGLVVFVAVFCAGVTVCFGTKPEEVLLTDKSFLNSLPKLSEDQIQTVECDGLKVRMISCVCSQETKNLYAIFEFSSADGEDMEENTQESLWVDFKGQVYGLDFSGSGGGNSKKLEKDGKIYLLVSRRYSEDKLEDVYCEVIKYGEEAAFGKFDIKDEYCVKDVLYFGENGRIALSNIGMKMTGNNLYNEEVNKMLLKYDDGSEKKIKLLSCNYSGNEYTYPFGSVVDIKGVTAIEYGGVEYKILSDTLDMNGYTKQEIDSALAIAKKEINDLNLKEYTIKEIHYSGYDICKQYQEYAEMNDADEAIVFDVVFDVEVTYGDDIKDNKTTYFKCCLVRKKGEKWKLSYCGI